MNSHFTPCPAGYSHPGHSMDCLMQPLFFNERQILVGYTGSTGNGTTGSETMIPAGLPVLGSIVVIHGRLREQLALTEKPSTPGMQS